MYNNLYTRLLSFTNRIFGSTMLMKDTISDDICEWIYNIYGIDLRGKSIYLNILNSRDICIIRTDDDINDNYILDEVLVDNKEVRVIIINNDYFNNMMERDIYNLLIDIYTHMTSELFKFKAGSLYKVNYYAPFILTLQTMDSFNLVYSTEWMSSIQVSILNYLSSSNDNIIDARILLNNGGIVAIVNDIEQNLKK